MILLFKDYWHVNQATQRWLYGDKVQFSTKFKHFHKNSIYV